MHSSTPPTSENKHSLDLTASSARTQRDTLAGRTEVLDKVGALRTLSDDMHAMTEQVATYYEVDRETILTVVKRNRDELDSDGYRIVTRTVFGETFNLNVSNLDPRARQIALFPRRAILRIGMLLRDSEVAKRVRDMLLDVEAETRPAELSEDEIIRNAVSILDRRIVALAAKNKELELKVEVDAPKVAKAEAHSGSSTSIHRQDFAREVQTWGKKVHSIWILQAHVMAFLAHKGVTIQGDRSDTGQATATAIRNGWAENVKRTDKKSGHTSFTAYLTPKGQDIAWKWITKHIDANGTLELPKDSGTQELEVAW
ncbi:phage antirepressor KilAC domain-containing protein [Nocardia sp. NPDC059246]|uniref:phage antirepressor KilAC domain-containing protein n=1 Tax=unclassified Nocardia TaxID=2637762 RepID=UPI003678AC70